jgi:hypothetical protein
MPVDVVIFSQDFVPSNLPEWQITISAPLLSLTGTILEKINKVITHNLFTGPLKAFMDGVINIVNKSPGYLEQTLKKYPSHTPHYALYLVFLRLFHFAQDHLNQYTQNHLDFYYRQVLQLKNEPAVPDFVHVVFELQKNVQQHLLGKGTKLKAGKDANNHDLFYTLTDDLVIQKANVQSLKSLFLDKENTEAITLYASPVANSEDGNGAKLKSPDKSWYPFRNPKNTHDEAVIGFAIASNLLYLNEGTRIITISFTCESINNYSADELTNVFTAQFTGNKKWFEASDYIPENSSGNITLSSDPNSNKLKLKIVLNGNAPPIVPYSAKLHGDNFTEALPMVKVLLNDYSSYTVIKSFNILTLDLQVEVDSVKNLMLQNNDGKIDLSKPFKPFGEFPEYDASFIIGSKEIFQKPLRGLTMNIEWPDTGKRNIGMIDESLIQLFNKTDNSGFFALKEGTWPAAPFTSLYLYGNTLELNNVNKIPVSDPDFGANENYQPSSVNGFIKVQLNDSQYNLKTYQDRVKSVLQKTETTITPNSDGSSTYTISNPPVVPSPPSVIFNSVSLSYSAGDQMIFNKNTDSDVRKDFFYHIEPFGYREMHPVLTDDLITLLPVFNLDDGSSALETDDSHNGGELWIGLNNAENGKTYSILFEVAEGTANPLEKVPSGLWKVLWYYLSQNNWKVFADLSVNDQTNNLSRSGLVVLSVPDDATVDNTRADKGLIWIKGVVLGYNGALCNIISINSNGAKAQFLQVPENNIEYQEIVPPNTISKLATSDLGIKKVQQPYASFGGRVHETDDQFYLRVSERLRHKYRALTAWDYERLVLQQFPQIHKVKCLNHTGFICDDITSKLKYSEVLPGHVTIVTIPDLKSQHNVNPLRPYTSIGLLTEIKQYLLALVSPFLSADSSLNEYLHLVNPQFEAVQFDFKVTFLPGYDETFYKNLLKDEIKRFLTPWAYDMKQEIDFGGKIEKSVVLNFVEERPYVDFVTCFKMNQYIPKDNSSSGELYDSPLKDIEEAVASTARSILVSYYDEETQESHLITTPANCDCNG